MLSSFVERHGVTKLDVATRRKGDSPTVIRTSSWTLSAILPPARTRGFLDLAGEKIGNRDGSHFLARVADATRRLHLPSRNLEIIFGKHELIRHGFAPLS